MDTPKIWEIWYADFKFEDSNESKDRPVLVVEEDGIYYVAAMITSHESRNEWYDVDIIRWKSAGLDKPSTIHGARVIPLPLEKFRRKIGCLMEEDICEYIRKNS